MKTKIFRISKQSISLLLSILMIVSMTLVGMVSTNASMSGLSAIYFTPDSNWRDGNATFKLKIDTSSGSSMINFQLVDSTVPVYKATLNSSTVYHNLQFLRFNTNGDQQLDSSYSFSWVYSVGNGNCNYYVKTGNNWSNWSVDDTAVGYWTTYTTAGNNDYYVAGDSGLCGSYWNPGDSKNMMTANGDGTYSITFENISAGTYGFKVTDGTWTSSWPSDNYSLTLNSTSNVTITFKSSDNSIVVDTESTSISTTYYIGGRFHIKSGNNYINTFDNGDWKAESTKIPFVSTGTTGLYKVETNLSVKELSEKISNQDPYFLIHTGSISNKDWYGGASDNNLNSFHTNTEDKKATLSTNTAGTETGTNRLIKFSDTTDTSENVVIYLDIRDGMKLYYTADSGGDIPVGDSNYYLYDYATDTSLGTFKWVSDNTDGTKNYTLSIQMTADNPYKLWLGDNQSGGEYYYADKELYVNGDAVTMYHYGNKNEDTNHFVKFVPDSTSVYKFTWVCNPDGTTKFDKRTIPGAESGKLSVKLDATPLADSVSLSTNTDRIMFGENVTLTATVDTPATNVSNFKYTFYENGTEIPNSSVSTTNTSFSYTHTPTSAGTKNYYVVVSTTDDDSLGIYAPVQSTTKSVKIGTPGVYYSSNITSDTDFSNVNWTEVTGEKATISTTLSAGDKYTFALSNKNGFPGEDFTTAYTWDESKSIYCSFEADHVTVGEDTITTYVIKPNTGCKNPIITIDKNTQTIYATATYTPSKTNTEESFEKVTYYFGEMQDNINWCLSGDGVKIKYWNNSTGKNAFCTTTDLVTVNNSDKIRVNTSDTELYKGPNAGYKEFKVYRAELPIWATTFAFVGGNGESIITTSSNGSGYNDFGTLALNPNRIYLFYAKDNNRYTKGVVLDEHLWNSNNTNNVPDTENFKANLINYKNNRTDLNNALSSYYEDNQYGNFALYFGDFNTSSGIKQDPTGLYGYKEKNNLAQRKDKDGRSYFASVWGLTGTKLAYSNSRSISEFGKLTGPDNETKMPLFDYDGALTNSNIASETYTDLNFPFYKSDFNGVTTYSYDSITDKNRRYDSEDTKDFKVSSEFATGQDTDGKQYTGYFPFGGNEDRQSNCGFGTEFQIEFYMTDSGKLYDNQTPAQSHDICFNFSGDDDVWVYVDGICVLDLGGDHKISAGSINFTDMRVYYKSAAKNSNEISGTTEDTYSYSSDNVNVLNLQEILEAHGVKFDNTDPSTKHTLQMFYMERGLYQSNCSISFNLPQNSGLRVASKVDTSNVQDVFVNDTLITANNDYFGYSFSNKAPSSDETGNVNSEYSTSITGASKLADDGFDYNSILYPLNNDIVRAFGTSRYQLALKPSRGSESSNYITSENGLNTVAGVNFKLNDSYLKGTSSNAQEAEEQKEMGASGRTSDSGIFNLLFDQDAQFLNIITPDSLLYITQLDTINSVVSSSGNVISPGTSNRNVTDYYTTTYSIYDDAARRTIIDANTPVKNTSGVLAKDSTTNNSFMFANHGTDATDVNIAMTATFTNLVDVGAIKIQKELVSGINANDDKFFFEVKFSNIFGSSDGTSKTYNFLYDVYNIGSSTPVITNQRYSNGIKIQANQYALIKGVPVGTKYTVTEKSRVGYSVDHVVTNAGYVGNGSATAPTVADNVVTGSIPTVGVIYDDAKVVGYSSISESIFFNTKQAISVTFKYYDREVVAGQVAHISTSPTSFTKNFQDYPLGSIITDENGEAIGLNLSQLITTAAGEFGGVANIDNVIDTYSTWTSQKEAESTMLNTLYIRNNRNYSTEEALYRTDCYGNPVDGEKWVTYYDANKKEVVGAEDKYDKHGNIKSITVWLFNQPKKYTVKMHTALTTDDITSGTDNYNGRYVANGNKSFEQTAYYNMRFGGDESYILRDENGNPVLDENGNQIIIYEEQNKPGFYLEAYGIKDGYIGESAYTEPNFVIDEGGTQKNLEFIGWSLDPQGKTIVSSEIKYLYRITRNITLYAVYGDPDKEYVNGKKPVGLTVTENQRDIYLDSNGKSNTRLNTQMNPYNCPMNDKNIEQVSIVYVMLTGTSRSHEFTDKDINTIRDGIKTVLANSTSTNVSGKVTVVEVQKNVNGFIYNVVESEDDISSNSDVILTNKNRLQFTTNFLTSNLDKGIRMLAFGAMNYAGEGWIVSDNYVDYDYYNK